MRKFALLIKEIFYWALRPRLRWLTILVLAAADAVSHTRKNRQYHNIRAKIPDNQWLDFEMNMIDKNTREKMVKRIFQMTDELSKESDRGSMIVAVAWIEDDLKRLLKSYLLPSLRSHENDDELFGVQGYLDAFAPKIDLAYRLGLIQEEFQRSLHLCRRVRNDFAHQFETLSFEHPRVRDRIIEIFRLTKIFIDPMWSVASEALPPEFTAKVPNGAKGSKALHSLLGTRWLFELVAATMDSGLLLAIDDLEPVKALD